MADTLYAVSSSDLTSVADAIRAKTGSTNQLTFPTGFSEAVGNIQTGGSAGETWMMNTTIEKKSSLGTQSIRFTSNGTSYTSMVFGVFNTSMLSYESTVVYSGSSRSWKNVAYRKVTFETAPTGNLLTWLEANAVKQASDTAAQDSKALTVTSNGSVTIKPDAPYDAVKQVDLVVNTGGNGVEVTIDASGLSSFTDNQDLSLSYLDENGSRNLIGILRDDPVTITVLEGSIGYLLTSALIEPVSNDAVEFDPDGVAMDYSNITSASSDIIRFYYAIIFHDSGTLTLTDFS